MKIFLIPNLIKFAEILQLFFKCTLYFFQEHCEDPPAFRESRRKAHELQLQKEEEALRKIELEVCDYI